MAARPPLSHPPHPRGGAGAPPRSIPCHGAPAHPIPATADLPSPRNWRRSELAALRRLYPAGGTRACLPALPNRTKAAIHGRAQLLGLRRTNRSK